MRGERLKDKYFAIERKIKKEIKCDEDGVLGWKKRGERRDQTEQKEKILDREDKEGKVIKKKISAGMRLVANERD